MDVAFRPMAPVVTDAFQLHLDGHRSPLPPAAAVSLLGRPFVAEWSPDAAYRCFLLLLPQCAFIAEATYEAVLDSGCPLDLAGEAWNRWCAALAELGR